MITITITIPITMTITHYGFRRNDTPTSRRFDEHCYSVVLTALFVVDGTDEHQVSRLHVFFVVDHDRESVVLVRLVPTSEFEPKRLLQIPHASPHQSTAVQKYPRVVLRLWKYEDIMTMLLYD